MIILGIESSCDDTSVALVDITDNEIHVLAEKTASQIDVHKKYGGVVPEIAGRMHAENMFPVIEEVMAECKMKNAELKIPNVIAVTSGPGLVTGLLVGVEAAKSLSYLWNVPLVGVNHIEGHMLSVLIGDQTTDYRLQTTTGDMPKSEVRGPKSIIFPALALVVSGGHTELILMKDYGDYEIIGKTRDDAAGECFDKVAKLLGLDYPGGPKISKLALEGNTAAVPFPRPMLARRSSKSEGGIDSNDFDFSFAGLKTSALYWLRDNTLSPFHVNAVQIPTGIFGVQQEPPTINDFCASFEQAIIDVLVTKTLRAAEQYHPKTIIIGGGVSANKKLRETLQSQINHEFPNFVVSLFPSPQYSMDNGAMIAVAGYFHAKKKMFTDWKELTAHPNWNIDEKPT